MSKDRLCNETMRFEHRQVCKGNCISAEAAQTNMPNILLVSSIFITRSNRIPELADTPVSTL